MIADPTRTRPGFGSDHEERDERHAVIDIGSNTVRLVVYGGPPRAPTVLWNEKVSARLGRDLERTGAIPEVAIEEALAALARFRLLAQELGISRIETVATAATREASNGAEFVRRVMQLGLPLKVLSGEEEARASAWGTIGAFPGATGLVADLGGGSLELIALEKGHCGPGATFPLGTLRLPTLRAKADFATRIAAMLATPAWGRNPGNLFMVGGTWRSLATYAMRVGDHPLTDPHGLIMSPKEAMRLTRDIARAEPGQLAKIRGISTMRAQTLPDAAALLAVLLEELAPEQLVFSSWGLREGLYFRSLTRREHALDPLLCGVMEFVGCRSPWRGSAERIATWIAPTARSLDARSERLRLAAAHLALALNQVEPNLRAAQALEWALDKRWVGINFAERATLGAALRGCLGLTDPHDRLTALTDANALREATGWGLALRLARRLGAGSTGPLDAARLDLVDGRLDLRIDDHHAVLATPTVEKALASLAKWLGVAPCMTVDENV